MFVFQNFISNYNAASYQEPQIVKLIIPVIISDALVEDILKKTEYYRPKFEESGYKFPSISKSDVILYLGGAAYRAENDGKYYTALEMFNEQVYWPLSSNISALESSHGGKPAISDWNASGYQDEIIGIRNKVYGRLYAKERESIVNGGSDSRRILILAACMDAFLEELANQTETYFSPQKTSNQGRKNFTNKVKKQRPYAHLHSQKKAEDNRQKFRLPEVEPPPETANINSENYKKFVDRYNSENLNALITKKGFVSYALFEGLKKYYPGQNISDGTKLLVSGVIEDARKGARVNGNEVKFTNTAHGEYIFGANFDIDATDRNILAHEFFHTCQKNPAGWDPSKYSSSINAKYGHFIDPVYEGSTEFLAGITAGYVDTYPADTRAMFVMLDSGAYTLDQFLRTYFCGETNQCSKVLSEYMEFQANNGWNGKVEDFLARKGLKPNAAHFDQLAKNGFAPWSYLQGGIPNLLQMEFH